MSWTLTGIGLVLLLGIITSYTDFKERKIKNKHLLTFSTIFIIFTILRVIYDQDIRGTDYIQIFLINFALVSILTIYLWVRNLIPPADAKLMMTFSLGIPLETYPQFSPIYFPFVLIMLIAFAIPAILSIIQGIKTMNLKKTKSLLKSPKLLIGIIAYNLYIIITESLFLINIRLNILYILVFFFIALYFFGRMDLKTKTLTWITVITFAITATFITYGSQAYKQFLTGLIIFPVIFGAIPILPDLMTNFSKRKKISELKEGMIPKKVLYLEEDKVKIAKELKDAHGKQILGMTTEGLTKKDIKILQKSNIKSIQVNVEYPFAPIILAGTILSIIITLS